MRFEKGERKPTFIHKELLSFLAFVHEKGLLDEYFIWRFGFENSSRFYKNKYSNGVQKIEV